MLDYLAGAAHLIAGLLLYVLAVFVAALPWIVVLFLVFAGVAHLVGPEH